MLLLCNVIDPTYDRFGKWHRIQSTQCSERTQITKRRFINIHNPLTDRSLGRTHVLTDASAFTFRCWNMP